MAQLVRIHLQCRRPEFDPLFGKVLWRREQLLTLVAQMVRSLPAVWETQVLSLGPEDPLEKDMATYSSILVWKIPRTEEPGRLQSMGSQRVGHDRVTSLSPSPTAVVWPGEFHGLYSPWGCKESDMTD